MAKKIDMTGWIMKEHGIPESRLTVIEEDKTYKKIHNISAPHAYWKCKCECGNIFSVNGLSIRQGKTLSCGCFKLQQLKKNNHTHLEGQKFNRLLVLEDDGHRNNDGKILWKCLCDCGEIAYATSYQLKAGHIQSCGCLQKEKTSMINAKDITGQRFGKLVAIKYVDSTQSGKRRWLCQCDCGKQHITTASLLLRGDTISCGCFSSSKGEELIKKILEENNIPYVFQYTYKDCKSPKDYVLRFDFYINNEFLLEYDGKQHFDRGWKNNFEYTKICDNIKTNYAITHNIPLKRIPYTQLNKLCLEDIMSNKWLINN